MKNLRVKQLKEMRAALFPRNIVNRSFQVFGIFIFCDIKKRLCFSRELLQSRPGYLETEYA